MMILLEKHGMLWEKALNATPLHISEFTKILTFLYLYCFAEP